MAQNLEKAILLHTVGVQVGLLNSDGRTSSRQSFQAAFGLPGAYLLQVGLV